MPKGLTSIPDGGGGRGGLVFHVRLRDDGESCKLRFLTDADEFYYEWFHRVEVGGKYQGDKICVQSALGESCKLCEQGAKSSMLFLAWVYEYYHDYPEPGEKRVRVSEGSRAVYREEVNEARLLKASGMHKGSIKMRFERFGTLLDHDYEWIRQGAKGTTRPVYLLEPLEKAKLPKELADLYASLPDLEDVAFDRVEKPEPKKERVGDAFEAELARVEVEENPFGTSSKNVTTEDSEDPF